MFFNPNKAAFRSGNVTSLAWNDINVGNYSTGFGLDVVASGISSVAMGEGTSAQSDNSIAMGYNARTQSNYAVSIGNTTTASGNSSFASGAATLAQGDYSTALGENTQAFGHKSTSLGSFTLANGDYSTAMGYLSKAYGNYSTALGLENEAQSFGETTIGTFATNYTPVSTSTFNSNDRLFTIGYGSNSGSRSNALTVLKNGNIGIGTSSPTAMLEIDGQVKITGGTPGEGKVLTSDAFGLATWETPVSNTSWSIFGNAGTIDDGTNFIGTTDNVPLLFKVNNALAGKIEVGAPAGTYFGQYAGNTSTQNIVNHANTGASKNGIIVNLAATDAGSNIIAARQGGNDKFSVTADGKTRIGSTTTGTFTSGIMHGTVAFIPNAGGAIAADGVSTQTVTITNTAVGDRIFFSAPNNLANNLVIHSVQVTAANTVTVKFQNTKATPTTDNVSRTFSYLIVKQ